MSEKELKEIKDEDILDEEPVVETKKETKSKNNELVESLKNENEALKKEKDELNNKYLLSLAEQKNYKKRLDDEMDRFYKYSTFDLCKNLIQILDSFDLALEKEVEGDDLNAYLSGFKLTRNQIFSILEKEGVKEVEALGKEFDPNCMLAVSQENHDDIEDQQVLKVFMKGYMYKDRVLRPANVIINVK